MGRKSHTKAIRTGDLQARLAACCGGESLCVCCSGGLGKERHASGATVKRYGWWFPVVALRCFVAPLVQGVG
jgi:hypothetical protein